MAHDEERQRKSRVVVETPNARREEYVTQTRRVPERQGFSTGVVATVALAAVAITALVVFLFMNMGSDATDTNVNISAATVPTPIPTVPTPYPTVPTPLPAMTQPPTVIVQQPPVTTEPAPVIITQPPTTTAPAPAASSPPTDADFESRINKAILDDAQLGALGISVTVVNGRATLTGTVATDDLKARAARVASTIRGVRVDNRIVVETP